MRLNDMKVKGDYFHIILMANFNVLFKVIYRLLNPPYQAWPIKCPLHIIMEELSSTAATTKTGIIA